jgi:hypothetical protein
MTRFTNGSAFSLHFSSSVAAAAKLEAIEATAIT